MAEKRIDQLPNADSVNGSDLFVIEQNGVAKKALGNVISSQFGGTAVTDVKINNVSVVTNRIAEIPSATSATRGVVVVDNALILNSTNPVQSKAIQAALNSKADSSDIHSIPSGGSSGQVLKKASGTDYDVIWANESGGGGGAVNDVTVDGTSVVSSGTAVIPKATSADFGVVKAYYTAASSPSGVDIAYIYNSTSGFSMPMLNPSGKLNVNYLQNGLPSGGTTGQVLVKSSGTSYDVAWANAPSGSGAFFATYGTTPFADIQAAYNNGLSVYCVLRGQESDEVFTLVRMDTDTQYLAATFIGGDWSNYVTYVEVDEQESWHISRRTVPLPQSSGYPAALGTANRGTSETYSRADHVHDMPDADDVGAIPAPSSPTIGDVLTWNGTAWVAAAPTGGGGGVLGVTQDQDGYLVLSPVSAVTEEDIDDTGAVTQALDAGVLYHFTGALTSLTITLNPVQTGMVAQYHFDFESGATAPTLTLPQTVVMPSGFSVAANTRYEIDILNNYGTVMSWATS